MENHNESIFDSALLQYIRDTVIILDKHFVIKNWNSYAEELYGWTEAEVLGKKTYELFETDYGQSSLAELTNELEKKGYYKKELRHRTKNGHYIDIYCSTSIIPDDAGSYKGMISIIKDISIRKNLEAETKKSTAILQSIKDAVYTLDNNYVITSWNKGAEEMYGWTEKEVIGRPGYEVLETEMITMSLEDAREKIKTLGAYTGEALQRNKADETLYVLVSASCIYDKEGNAVSTVAICRNITHQKNTEQQLRKLTGSLQDQVEHKTRELSAIFERITDGFAALNASWEFTFINKNGAEIFLREPALLMGKNIWTEFPEAIGAPFHAHCTQAMESQQFTVGQSFYPVHHRWVEYSLYPSPEGLSLYFKDITEHKNSERKLAKINRLYQFLSRINQMLLRTTSQDESIYREACKIAIETGKFRMAWVGLIDPKTKNVVPVTYEGLGLDYLNVIKVIAVRDKPEGRGPSGIALQEGRTAYCNDIENDPIMLPWREEALKRNYRSSIAIPIFKFGKILGTFTLYADTKNYFDDEEIVLLEKVSSEIGFFLEISQKEAMRKKAEEAVLKSERRYQSLSEISPAGIFHTNKDGYVTYVNKRWSEISGIPVIEASGIEWLKAVHEEDKPRIEELWIKPSNMQKTTSMEFRFRHTNGAIRWVWAQVLPERNSENQIVGFVGAVTDITERKKAEDEILKAYQEKESVLNRISDGMVSLDAEWRYTFLNDAALATHPKSREETIGKTIWEVHPGMAGTTFANMYYEAMETKKALQAEDYYAPMDIWFLAKAYPSEDGLTIFYSNITETKKTQQKIQKTLEQLNLSQTIAQLGYWEIDLKKNTAFWSDEMYNLCDEDSSLPVTSEMFYKNIHPEDQKLVTERVSQIIHKERFSDSLEYQMVKKDGSIRHMLATSQLTIDDNGNPILVNGTMQDITNRKNIEIDLSREKYLSDSIISNLPGVFYIIDDKGAFIRWNKNFETVTGYSTDEISVMNRLDLVDKNEVANVKQAMRIALSNGKESIISHFISKEGKKTPYYLTGMSINYLGYPSILVIGIDYSEREKIMEEINKTSTELLELTNHLQSIREEERKRIGRELHDDLGQQLTVMKMDIAWINKRIPENSPVIKEKLKFVLEMLDSSNTSLRRILNELRPTILDEHGLLDALHWHAKQFTGNTGVPVEFIGANTDILVSDEIATCVFRAFQESLTNITRYAEAKKVVTSIFQADSKLLITIEDDGKGFDVNGEQPKSRQPFGLMGMKERVKALKGNIELTSEIGKGTRISIALPLK